MGAMRRFGSDRERRHRRANALYEFEMLLREEGISDFVYDEEKDLFRFPDGQKDSLTLRRMAVARMKENTPLSGC